MNLVKQRFLDIASSGVFAHMAPPALETLHADLHGFLQAHADALDAADLFSLYELHFLVSLLTNRDVQAKAYLDRFNDQFAGKRSQKLMVLRSMYHEAVGDADAAVHELGSDPDELRASRRLATFPRRRPGGAADPAEYIRSLNYYLDLQASDVAAWAELGDQYSAVGHYDKAVFCFKEVLLHVPTAYNVHYKAGLNSYLQHLQVSQRNTRKETLAAAADCLEAARDAFLRAAELSASYTKAWVGVYTVARAPLWDQLKAHKALVSRVPPELAELAALGRRRVMDIERVDAAGFEALLESR